jgi:hypothetical protein
MTDLRLSAREAEDVLAGRQPDGRADLAPVAEVAAVLHASREVEPPPPISDSLRAQIDGGVPRQATAVRRRRHRPRHMQAVPSPPTVLASYRRPVASVAAAAAVLIGLVVATSGGHLPDNVHSAVADMGSAIGLDVFRGDDAAPAEGPTTSSSSTTTTTTAAPTTTVPPSTTTSTVPPPTPAPAGPPPEGGQLPWWLSPEAWEQWGFGQWDGDDQWSGDGRGGNYDRDGDRDGDGDGGGAGSGSGDGRGGMTRPNSDSPDGTGSTLPPTTAAPTSTSSTPSTTTGSSTATTQ